MLLDSIYCSRVELISLSIGYLDGRTRDVVTYANLVSWQLLPSLQKVCVRTFRQGGVNATSFIAHTNG